MLFPAPIVPATMITIIGILPVIKSVLHFTTSFIEIKALTLSAP
ncbi:hypothetical protein CU026_2168 [Enterococcus faecium]|nr:hypothetical protein [Enterococcus faecium]MBK4755842.1 hypothetical protein [Enterococcus faecium]MBK4767296.1 hypothetical protein [Enterococcus faecium]MBK4793704.1 hypothetical protein [Enterococcus faecium]MBK4796419.1 hypothetical protein [Enterococcus faecium]